MSAPLPLPILKPVITAAMVAHKHGHKILSEYHHELFIACIPLVVDFHLTIFFSSVGGFFFVYILETIITARRGN